MNAVTLECPLCHGIIQVDPSAAGQQIACPLCQGTMQVPSAAALSAAAASPAPPPAVASPPPIKPGPWPPVPLELMALACPSCGNTFQVPPTTAGMQLPCPSCRQLVAIPAPATEAAPPPVAAPEPAAPGARSSALDELLPPSVVPAEPNLPPAGSYFSAPAGQGVALEERPKLLGEGSSEIEVRRLSPREKARRRAIRNVILFILGLAGLAAISIAMMR